MADGTIGLNAGTGGGLIDTEDLSVAGQAVKRERMIIAGRNDIELLSLMNSIPSPGVSVPTNYGIPVRSVPGPITIAEQFNQIDNPLDNGELYQSQVFDTSRGAVFSIYLKMDKDGYIQFQESTDGGNFYPILQLPTVANVSAKDPSYMPGARFFRVAVVNAGGSTTGFIFFQVLQRYSPVASKISLQWPVYSTLANLTAGGTFTTQPFISQCGEYPLLFVLVKSDQDGVLNIGESLNGIEWLDTAYSYSGGTTMRVEYRRTTVFMRLSYVNGASDQNDFFLFASMSNT